jgi:hypothetical protein
MIKNVLYLNRDHIIVQFDNRDDIVVSSDDGTAIHLVERLLSPRPDTTLSEWIRVMQGEDEITEVIELKEAI